MEGYIYSPEGSRYALPPALSWEFSYGFCAPCDSFLVRFLYAPEMLLPLTAAHRFRAVEAGETVFYGVVDEFELSATAKGCLCTLRGRGMQALLLDSEAERADYSAADAEFILKQHVYPLGVTEVGALPAAGRTAAMRVESGESHWSVVKRFAEFCLGLSPRFTKEGRLLFDGAESGVKLRLGSAAAISAQKYVFDRYGVLSEAIVKARTSGARVVVENPEMISLGGKCVRVINVPRRTGFDSMKHTAAYQIEKSKADMLRCTLTLGQCFAAFPGDRVLLESTPLGITGEYRVTAARSFAEAAGAGTTLELRKGG